MALLLASFGMWLIGCYVPAAARVLGTAVPLLQVLRGEGRHVFRPGLKNALQQR